MAHNAQEKTNHLFNFQLNSCSMHFSIDNYFGWTTAYILQLAMCCFYNYWVAVFLLFYISLYFCADAIANDLVDIVYQINLSVSESLNKNLTEVQIRKTKLLFTEWIDLHNDYLGYFFRRNYGYCIVQPLFCFRFINSVRAIMTGPLFIEFSSCIISIVLELLAIDNMIKQKSKDSTFATSAGTLSIHMTMVYFLCIYGEHFANQCFNVTKTVYSDLLWYKLPIKQQNFVIFSICRSQKRFQLEGLSIFNASMEIFSKVRKISHFFPTIVYLFTMILLIDFISQIIRTSISYFIIMRQLKAEI